MSHLGWDNGAWGCDDLPGSNLHDIMRSRDDCVRLR
jgi:hypothetical protein